MANTMTVTHRLQWDNAEHMPKAFELPQRETFELGNTIKPLCNLPSTGDDFSAFYEVFPPRKINDMNHYWVYVHRSLDSLGIAVADSFLLADEALVLDIIFRRVYKTPNWVSLIANLPKSLRIGVAAMCRAEDRKKVLMKAMAEAAADMEAAIQEAEARQSARRSAA